MFWRRAVLHVFDNRIISVSAFWKEEIDQNIISLKFLLSNFQIMRTYLMKHQIFLDKLSAMISENNYKLINNFSNGSYLHIRHVFASKKRKNLRIIIRDRIFDNTPTGIWLQARGTICMRQIWTVLDLDSHQMKQSFSENEWSIIV